MEITVHEQTDDKLTFTLDGTHTAYANTLRRLMLGEVPTMAIEDVTFYRNDSVLYDEMIAHRLGLVVLTADLDTYKMSDERVESPQYELKIGLTAEGPKTIYAKDLDIKDPNIKAVYPDTIIVKLLEGQSLELEATAILGTGRQHMKWSPGLVYYSYEPIIKVNNKKNYDKDDFPPQVFNDKGQIDAKLINTPHLIDACVDVDPDVVDIQFDNTKFRFTVESFGALTAKTIVEQAISVFEAQIKDAEGLIKGL